MQTKICNKCNIEKPITEFHKQKAGKYGVSAECKACRCEYKKQYYQKNKEHVAKINKQYRENNQEYVAEINKIYCQKNKERIAEFKKLYYKHNKERISEICKQYRQTSKGKYVAKSASKKYSKTPKGRASIKANNQNRRAQKKNNGGKHTGAEILLLFELQSGKCVYCECKLYKSGNNKYHIDHVVPLSKGGSNDIKNIQLLCPKCNLQKGAKYPEEFAFNFNKFL